MRDKLKINVERCEKKFNILHRRYQRVFRKSEKFRQKAQKAYKDMIQAERTLALARWEVTKTEIKV
jgi:hypothetical protein